MWVEKDIKKVLVSEQQISERSKELGAKITEDYTGKQPLLVALLRGSVPFLAEPIKHIDLDIQYDFMDVSSYEGTESIGDIRILKDLDTSVKGLDILLVEDIVDTGTTLHYLLENLHARGAKSVRLAALLNKPDRRKMDVEVDYVGFIIPDYFVIGYGLDYAEKYRHLPYIGILKEEMYQN